MVTEHSLFLTSCFSLCPVRDIILVEINYWDFFSVPNGTGRKHLQRFFTNILSLTGLSLFVAISLLQLLYHALRRNAMKSNKQNKTTV